MDLLKNMVYYLPNNMVIKDMVSQKNRLKLDALWEIHPRMSIDARRIHECHVKFWWMLEVYFLVDVDGYCTDGYCTDTSYYETTSSLTPSASAIG